MGLVKSSWIASLRTSLEHQHTSLLYRNSVVTAKGVFVKAVVMTVAVLVVVISVAITFV